MVARPYQLLLSTVPEETANNDDNEEGHRHHTIRHHHHQQQFAAIPMPPTSAPPPYPLSSIKNVEKQDVLRTFCLASSLLLKVLLLLAASLLLMTALSVLVPWLLHQRAVIKEMERNTQNESTSSSNNGNQPAMADERMLNEFLAFEKNYSRTLTSDEERVWRYWLFVRNMRELEQRIAMAAGNAAMTEWGITEFFDWSGEELAKLVMPLRPQMHKKNEDEPGVHEDDDEEERGKILMEVQSPLTGYTRPKHWDWRDKGVVTHVKSQLRCGACWAFAVTALVETQHAIKNGTLLTLSEQQLIDCDESNNGCEGGYRPNAFRYIRDNGQLMESAYPYRGNDGKCSLPPGPIDPSQRVFVDQLRSLPANEEQIADWIAQNGPVTFGMTVTKAMFQYRGGVFSPSAEECAHQAVGSHAMEVIGYGEISDAQQQPVPYWIMKNSWGSGWGVNGGYLLMRRGLNACGLAREVYTALIN